MKPLLYALGVVTLVAAVLFGLWRIEVRRHVATSEALETAHVTVARLEIEAEQTRLSIIRQNEQCATDLAGEIERGKAEAARARDAGTAIARLSAQCVNRADQPAVNRELRKLLGESGP